MYDELTAELGFQVEMRQKGAGGPKNGSLLSRRGGLLSQREKSAQPACQGDFLPKILYSPARRS